MISSPRVSIRVAAILIPLVLAVMISVGYTMKVDRDSDHENEKNDRKWCQLLIEVDEAFKSAPPVNESGKRVAQAFHDRRVELGC